MDFSGKTVVVTGGASGIGRATVIAFAEAGADVFFGDVNEAGAEETLSMVDGATPVSDLVSVSGMDRFEALRAIYRMHQAGIVEWEAS